MFNTSEKKITWVLSSVHSVLPFSEIRQLKIFVCCASPETSVEAADVLGILVWFEWKNREVVNERCENGWYYKFIIKS